MFKLIAKLFYTILLLVETLISIRLVFVFIDASRASQVVDWVIKTSDIFVSPFNGIIADNIQIGNFIVDTTALLALIVYMILAFIAIELIKAFTPHHTNKH